MTRALAAAQLLTPGAGGALTGPESQRAFCDFCTCENCRTGKVGNASLDHAQTEAGTWICDVCFAYDVCTADGPNRNPNGPCDEERCLHRPRLVTEWTTLTGPESAS